MPGTLPVTAVIVSYNSAHVLPSCIQALKAEGAEVLVVDNASTDDSADIARQAGAEVIVNPLNEGYGRANNIGAHAARCDYVLFINPDAVVEKWAVHTLFHAMEALPKPALMAPVLEEPDGRLCEEKDGPLGAYLSGACLFVKRSLFLELGGFDPEIFLFYEDDDLSRRFRDKGHSLHLVKKARARHIRGGSTQSTPQEETLKRQYIVRYHQAWSYFYICHKYGLDAPLWRWLMKFTAKYMIALATGNALRKARYAGSLAGAWDFKKGKRAIMKQGLA